MDVYNSLTLPWGPVARSIAASVVRFALFSALFVLAGPSTFGEPPKDDTGKAGDGSESLDRETTAAVHHPYDDLRQQAIPFGLRSFYLTPWRAYLDTWPAKQYLDCLGINFNVDGEDAKATARVLAEAGFRSARVEFGWGNLGYDNPKKISNAGQYAKIFAALRSERIRPLILLNANAGAPVPFRTLRVSLRRTAPRGACEIVLDRVSDIRPGYTGLMSAVAQKIAFPLITSVDSATGRCDLSAPLPHELAAGPLILVDLRYHPFSRPVFEDGKPNPLSEDTIRGWRTYVATVCALMKEYLGTEGAEDAGFDLEVWNELTFGSDFLSEDSYYQPKRAFKGNIVYQSHGLIAQGVGSILGMTVDYVNDPTSRLPGVHVISGLSNQRPWESGFDLWPGQTGFSRHFYTALDPDRPFNSVCGFLSPETIDRPGEGPLNALGLFDGRKDGKDWHTVVPGSFFAPTLQISMPELWYYGYKIEYVARDLQPFPGAWARHFRFSNPGNGDPAEVWMTETNTDRSGWLNQLRKQQGLALDDPRLIRLSHHVGAKALLRTFVFQSHKGLHTIEAFAAREKDLQLAIIPEAFFAALKQEDHSLTDHVRAMAGEQLALLSRVNQLMRQSEPISVPRTLDISEIVEHEPRLVSKGDGTPAHPDRFNRDDFACLPFQLTPKRYAIPYYIVTQNMVHDWRPELDPLDPARYDMPEQIFDVTLDNLNGAGAKVSVWDPFSKEEIPATILSATSTSLAVRLPTVDYPRFLIVEEVEPGPLILNPNLQGLPSGAVKVSFQTNLPVEAKLSWGPWPRRNAGGNVDLPAGMAFSYTIPELTEHEGVKVKVTRAGLISCWPHWDYDVAGVRWPQTFEHPALPDPVHPPLARLPGLPPSRLPDAYNSKLPPGLSWRDQRDERTVSVGSDPMVVRVSLKLIGTDSDSSSRLLPDLSVMDWCTTTLETLGEARGWRAEIKLDSSTHPWDRENDKIVYIFPTSKGWLRLQWEGDEAAFAVNRDTLQQILVGLSFSFGEW